MTTARLSVFELLVGHRGTETPSGSAFGRCVARPLVRVVGAIAGVALEVLAAARAGEGRFVGEVAVDGDPSYLGALGDLAHCCRRRPDRLVQLDRGLDDPLPGLVLVLGATLELIRAAHPNDSTCCTAKLDMLHADK